MILVDVNILVYAYNSAADEHSRATHWLQQVLSGTEPVGFSWSVVHAFLRLVTNKRVVPSPLTTEEALAVAEDWFAQPIVSIVNPGRSYWTFLRAVLTEAQVKGDIVNDAHIAALALEQNAVVVTADRDFNRFPGVRVINPLA